MKRNYAASRLALLAGSVCAALVIAGTARAADNPVAQIWSRVLQKWPGLAKTPAWKSSNLKQQLGTASPALAGLVGAMLVRISNAPERNPSEHGTFKGWEYQPDGTPARLLELATTPTAIEMKVRPLLGTANPVSVTHDIDLSGPRPQVSKTVSFFVRPRHKRLISKHGFQVGDLVQIQIKPDGSTRAVLDPHDQRSQSTERKAQMGEVEMSPRRDWARFSE